MAEESCADLDVAMQHFGFQGGWIIAVVTSAGLFHKSASATEKFR
jgi:hypothetical protein